jgi:hypothetical protein
MIRTLWQVYSFAAGIFLISAAISLLVIKLASSEGPVVEAIKPAAPISTKIPYGGTLGYRVSTRRLESCEGNVLYTFIRNQPNISVVISRPVMSQEIRPMLERVVRIELPDNVHPGRWRFQSIVDSRCPAHSRQDVIADFGIEVLEPEIEGE